MSRPPIHPGAAIVLLVLLAYLPAARGGFIWDDDSYVVRNPTLHTGEGLGQIWAEPTASPQYDPLVFTTFWVEYRLWGLDPLGFHLTNILLHAANVVLLWRVLRRLAVPGAWLAAAAFALHPVHVESVAWVTERKNVLSGFFYLAAALAYLRAFPPEPDAARPPRPAAVRYYLLAVGLFAAALLSKTVASSLPAALLLVVWWKRDRVRSADVLPLVPLFLIGLALALVTVWLEKHHVGAEGREWSLTPAGKVLVAGRAVAFYAGKLAVPVSLTFIYPRWAIDPAAGWQYLYPAAVVGTAAALWLARGRIGRGPLTGFLFFVGTLAPVLGFFDVDPMRYSYVADHFQYLASIGLITLAASGAALLYRAAPDARKPAAIGAAAVALAALCVGTWVQGRVYKDLESLWLDTVAKNPDCWMANNNLGVLYSEKGEPEKARACFLESLRVDPSQAEIHNNLGVLLMHQGDFVPAVEHLDAARRLDPSLRTAEFHAGGVLMRLEKWADASARFADILRRDPDMPQANSSLGMALFQQGHLVAAEPYLARAVALIPRDTETRYNLALCRLLLGRPGDALPSAEELVRQQPSVARFHVMLASVRKALGRAEEARAGYDLALQMDPQWPGFAAREAWPLATHPDPGRRNGRLAVHMATIASDAVADKDPFLLDVRAAALAEAGRFDEAKAVARQAIDRATENHAADLARQIGERLALYENRRPYRVEASPAP